MKRQPPHAVRRWLVVLATGFCLSLPIAIMLLLAWPFVRRPIDLALLDVDLIVLSVVAASVGTGLAAFAHRNRT